MKAVCRFASSFSTPYRAIEIQKNLSAMGYFSREILIHRRLRQEFPCPIGLRLISWRGTSCMRTVYELKSRIWFWEEYNHFERIYRVYRFHRFPSNFAKTFKE